MGTHENNIDMGEIIHHKYVPVWKIPFLLLLTYNLYYFFWMYRVIDELFKKKAIDISPRRAVGLLFIPLYNIYWSFHLWRNLERTLKAEYHKYKIKSLYLYLSIFAPLSIFATFVISLKTPSIQVFMKCFLLNVFVLSFVLGNIQHHFNHSLDSMRSEGKPKEEDGPPLHCAGFMHRVAAGIIDLFVASALCLLLLDVFFNLNVPEHVLKVFGENSDVFAVILFVITVLWFYFTFQESSAWKATVGKRMVGILVADTEGRRIGFIKASERFWVKMITLGIGFLLVGFTDKNQSLHDKIAGSIVYKKRSSKITSIRPWFGHTLVIVMTVITFLLSSAKLRDVNLGELSSVVNYLLLLSPVKLYLQSIQLYSVLFMIGAAILLFWLPIWLLVYIFMNNRHTSRNDNIPRFRSIDQYLCHPWYLFWIVTILCSGVCMNKTSVCISGLILYFAVMIFFHQKNVDSNTDKKLPFWFPDINRMLHENTQHRAFIIRNILMSLGFVITAIGAFFAFFYEKYVADKIKDPYVEVVMEAHAVTVKNGSVPAQNGLIPIQIDYILNNPGKTRAYIPFIFTTISADKIVKTDDKGFRGRIKGCLKKDYQNYVVNKFNEVAQMDVIEYSQMLDIGLYLNEGEKMYRSFIKLVPDKYDVVRIDTDVQVSRNENYKYYTLQHGDALEPAIYWRQNPRFEFLYNNNNIFEILKDQGYISTNVVKEIYLDTMHSYEKEKASEAERYYEKGNASETPDEAIRNYKMAVKLSKDQKTTAVYYYKIAYECVKKNDYKGACEYLEKSKECDMVNNAELIDLSLMLETKVFDNYYHLNDKSELGKYSEMVDVTVPSDIRFMHDKKRNEINSDIRGICEYLIDLNSDYVKIGDISCPNPELYIVVGDIYNDIGDLERANINYEEAYEHIKDSNKYYQCSETLKNLAGIIERYKKIEKDIHYANSFFNDMKSMLKDEQNQYLASKGNLEGLMDLLKDCKRMGTILVFWRENEWFVQYDSVMVQLSTLIIPAYGMIEKMVIPFANVINDRLTYGFNKIQLLLVENMWLLERGVYYSGLGMENDEVSLGLGVKIKSINKDSDAKKAGMKDDDVILLMNKEKVEDCQNIVLKLKEIKKNEIVEFSVFRDNELKNIPVTFRTGFGVEMEDISKQKAVKVTRVITDSAANRAGLKVGDYILSVNMEPVMDKMDLRLKLNRYNPGNKVMLTVYRDEQYHLMPVTLQCMLKCSNN